MRRNGLIVAWGSPLPPLRLGAVSLVMLCSACATSGESSVNLDEAARINTQLGADYLRSGKRAMAQEKLEKAIRQDPGYAPARTTLALVYVARGDRRSAEQQFRIALDLEPENPQTLNNFGAFLCTGGRLDEAAGFLVKAAKTPRYDTPAAAWTNAGACLRKARPAEAERYLREALRVQPDYPGALSQLAWISLQRKDFLRARGFVQRYEGSGAAPTAELLWVAALTEEALGDTAAAKRYKNRLLTEFPASEEAAELSKTNAS